MRFASASAPAMPRRLPIAASGVLLAENWYRWEPSAGRKSSNGAVRGWVVSGLENGNGRAAGPADEVLAVRSANAHLETTIRSMREQLERERARGEAAVRDVQSGLAGEISALKATIQEIRDRLQATQDAGEAKAESVRTVLGQEIAQLKSTIAVLRGELEAGDRRRQQEIADLNAAFARERELLQQHIKALRDELAAAS